MLEANCAIWPLWSVATKLVLTPGDTDAVAALQSSTVMMAAHPVVAEHTPEVILLYTGVAAGVVGAAVGAVVAAGGAGAGVVGAAGGAGAGVVGAAVGAAVVGAAVGAAEVGAGVGGGVPVQLSLLNLR